jgi:hypothetical protein
MHDQTQQQPTYHQRSGEYMSSKLVGSLHCAKRGALQFGRQGVGRIVADRRHTTAPLVQAQ